MNEPTNPIVTPGELPKPELKPGLLTSEFWTSIIALVGGFLVGALALVLDHPAIGSWLAAGGLAVSGLYVLGRVILKSEREKRTNVIPDAWEPFLQKALDEMAKRMKDAGKVFTIALLALLPMFACVGCGVFGAGNEKAELLAARHTYAGVVNSLAAARRAGAFTKARAEEIGRYIDLAGDLLDDWEAGLRLGEKTAPTIENWRVMLRRLVAAQIEAERAAMSPAATQPSRSARRRRRRRRGAGLDPVSLLLWGQVVLELVNVPVQLVEIFRRIQNGQPVTEDELLQAKTACQDARKNWADAGAYDKP